MTASCRCVTFCWEIKSWLNGLSANQLMEKTLQLSPNPSRFLLMMMCSMFTIINFLFSLFLYCTILQHTQQREVDRRQVVKSEKSSIKTMIERQAESEKREVKSKVKMKWNEDFHGADLKCCRVSDIHIAAAVWEAESGSLKCLPTTILSFCSLPSSVVSVYQVKYRLKLVSFVRIERCFFLPREVYYFRVAKHAAASTTAWGVRIKRPHKR